jgi:hypothetical protein
MTAIRQEEQQYLLSLKSNGILEKFLIVDS